MAKPVAFIQIQFNFFFNLIYPTRGNFVVVIQGSSNNEDIKLKEQYNQKHNTTSKGSYLNYSYK